jgi:hypothetical protein
MIRMAPAYLKARMPASSIGDAHPKCNSVSTCHALARAHSQSRLAAPDAPSKAASLYLSGWRPYCTSAIELGEVPPLGKGEPLSTVTLPLAGSNEYTERSFEPPVRYQG